MNTNKIVKAISAVVFLCIAVILLFLIIQDAGNGLGSWEQKGFFAMYIALFIYALVRIVVLLKDVFRK